MSHIICVHSRNETFFHTGKELVEASDKSEIALVHHEHDAVVPLGILFYHSLMRPIGRVVEQDVESQVIPALRQDGFDASSKPLLFLVVSTHYHRTAHVDT